jgi:hypothetical protein
MSNRKKNTLQINFSAACQGLAIASGATFTSEDGYLS